MCWDCYATPGGDPYKIYVQGGVPIDDFDKEVNYQTRMKGRGYKSKRSKKPKDRGCVGNDMGAHVYVWTVEENKDSFYSWMMPNEEYFKQTGFYRYEYLRCAGCGRLKKQRYTEEFAKRVAKFGWYRASYPRG